MAYSYTEHEVTTLADGTHETSDTTVTVDDVAEQEMQDTTQRAISASTRETLNEVVTANAAAIGGVLQSMDAPAPQYLTPGATGFASMPNGQALSVGANGEIYLDAVQLQGVAAAKMVQFGLSIYAQGKTQPSWWRWTGGGWVQVTAFDPNILK